MAFDLGPTLEEKETGKMKISQQYKAIPENSQKQTSIQDTKCTCIKNHEVFSMQVFQQRYNH